MQISAKSEFNMPPKLKLRPDIGLFLQNWLSHRFSYNDWTATYTVTLDQLEQACLIDDDSHLSSDLRAVNAMLWSQDRMTWQGLGTGQGDWTPLPSLNNQYGVVNKVLHPDRVFIFCSESGTDRHVPGSFFLRAAAARAMQEAIETEKLPHLCVPKVSLVALSPMNIIKHLPEAEQPHHFVLVINTSGMRVLCNEPEAGLDDNKCRQLAQLCCLGFPISLPGWTCCNKLVLIPSCLSCFSLNEPNLIPGQYKRTKELMNARELTRLNLARISLRRVCDLLVIKENATLLQLFETARYELEKHVLRFNKNSRDVGSSLQLPTA